MNEYNDLIISIFSLAAALWAGYDAFTQGSNIVMGKYAKAISLISIAFAGTELTGCINRFI